MARPLRWRSLSIGLGGIAAVIGLSLIVLLFARVGGVRGPKETIYITAATARGVLKGTEVMLMGKRIGTVERIDFLPPHTDTLSRLVLQVSVLRNRLPLIRKDAMSHIRPAGTIIGAPVIDIDAGTSTAAALRPGDTVRAMPQVAAERLMDRVEMLTDEVSGAFKDWGAILADVRSASGTYGSLRVRTPRELATFRGQIAQARRRLRGDGSLPLAMRDPELGARTSRVLATADSIGSLLASDQANLGRFRRDTMLVVELNAVRSELAVLSAAVNDARGTVGRAQHDRALSQQLEEIGGQLELLLADIKRNPLRYLNF